MMAAARLLKNGTVYSSARAAFYRGNLARLMHAPDVVLI